MDAVGVVRRWVAAVNALDVDAMVELADPEVRIHSHTTHEGHDGVREFARRQTFGARMQVANLRTFHDGGDTVVTEDEMAFVSVDDGSVMGREVFIARFVVRDGRVAEVSPARDLAGALADAGLGEDDLVA